MAKAIIALLEEAGHQVTWLIGANSYQPVTDANGGFILSGLTPDGQTQEVDCRQYQVAFVDGQLEGKLPGSDIVELLVASKVACCGMSTESKMNVEMVTRGAKMAAKKPVVFVALLSRRLSVESIARPTRSLVTMLGNLESRFMTPEFQDLRHEADGRVMAFFDQSAN